MQIKATDNYRHYVDCGLEMCERHYCSEHRLLWRDCDTMKRGMEGDCDVVNGLHGVWELGDCPTCEKEAEHKKLYQEYIRRYPTHAVCPECLKLDEHADDTAIHLVDHHKWDSEKARLWLRDKVEEEAFYKEP